MFTALLQRGSHSGTLVPKFIHLLSSHWLPSLGKGLQPTKERNVLFCEQGQALAFKSKCATQEIILKGTGMRVPEDLSWALRWVYHWVFKSKNLKPQKQPKINYFAQPPFFFFFPVHPLPPWNKEKVWKVREMNAVCISNSPKEGETNRTRDYQVRSVTQSWGELFSF